MTDLFDQAWKDFRVAMSNKAAVERLARQFSVDKWKIARQNGGWL